MNFEWGVVIVRVAVWGARAVGVVVIRRVVLCMCEGVIGRPVRVYFVETFFNW